jgi:L-ascorbate metabolism protein UlaG (beta-lactamase superfamily)
MRVALSAAVVLFAVLAFAQHREVEKIPTASGEIRITPIRHASLMIEMGEGVIHIDPWSQGNYSGLPKAGLVLITDIHGDHLDPKALAEVRKADTKILAPGAAKERVPEAEVIRNGESKTVQGIQVEAVPMYNLQRGPQPGLLFHDKGRGNGYVVTLGGKRLYFSGDTECVPEIKALKNIDVAFLTMNLPYTMPPDEAAACVKAFRPKVVYPYHYRGSDLKVFEEALKGEKGIEVRVRNWYY